MKNSITKKQFEMLKPFERYFEQAKNGYLTALPFADMKKLAAIYSELGGNVTNLGCHNCCYRCVRALSEYYFAYKGKCENR